MEPAKTWDFVRTLLAAAFLGLAILKGPGWVNRWWTKQQETREVRAVLSEEWGALVAGASVVHVGEQAVDTVIEFGDYQCPPCQAFARRSTEVLAGAPSILLLWRHLPAGSAHPYAKAAAHAAICAEEQGRFEAMHGAIFALDDWSVEPDWVGLAEQAGIEDTDVLVRCLNGPAPRRRLETDRALAQRLGIQATPTFVGRDFMHTGLPSAEWAAARQAAVPGRR